MQENNFFSLKAYNTFAINSTINPQNWHILTNFSAIERAYLTYLNQYKLSPHKKPYYLLGGGSNIVLAQSHFHDINFYWFANTGIEIIDEPQDNVFVEVQAGTNWHDFVDWCVRHEYYGVENLALIPGTVGACPVQNIGAYGVEVKDCIHIVKTFHDGQYKTILKDDCEFAYRSSLFKKASQKSPQHNPYWITSVIFKLSKIKKLNLTYKDLSNKLTQENSIEDVYNTVSDIRRNKLPDPLNIGNAGSFFKNPVILRHQLPHGCPFFEVDNTVSDSDLVKIPAAWLIEQLNIKGTFYQNTPIGVHHQHALVLIHDFKKAKHDNISVDNSSVLGKIIIDFSQKIIDEINERFGILLEREVNLWH